MNVYDFDGTIYQGDSTLDFYFFCIKNNIFLIKFLPYQFYTGILYLFGKIDKNKFKENFYIFLKEIDDVEYFVEMFWEINKKNTKVVFKREEE